MTVQVHRRRFTVDEYYRMAAAGILGEDDRAELIDGEVVEMAPIGPRHAGHVPRVSWHFGQRLGDVALPNTRNPLRIDAHNEPQPDIALVRPRADFYTTSHPTPEDVLLMVEVADTSADYDRRVKLPLYASAGIPEAWLLDLNRDALLVHCDPTPAGYRTLHTLRRGERVAPLAFPDRELSVEDLLGPPERI